MRQLMRLMALCALAASPPAFAHQPDGDHVQIVRDFVAAFNAHDSAAMSRFVTEDIQWLSIRDATVSIDASGKVALITAMDDYFQSCPTCRSELAEVIASRERVSAIEVATWHDKDEPRSQRSISVYEFAGDLIRRVYYFPAEKQGGAR